MHEKREREGVPTSNDREQPGVIDEVMPKSLFRVRLQDGRMLRAGLDDKSRHGIVRLLKGDAVIVRIFEHDPTRGSIQKKL
jgi:translation initiation factor IF-1